jgi:hypothetical protein
MHFRVNVDQCFVFCYVFLLSNFPSHLLALFFIVFFLLLVYLVFENTLVLRVVILFMLTSTLCLHIFLCFFDLVHGILFLFLSLVKFAKLIVNLVQLCFLLAEFFFAMNKRTRTSTLSTVLNTRLDVKEMLCDCATRCHASKR